MNTEKNQLEVEFAELVRARSREHTNAMRLMAGMPGVRIGLIRQELDSLIRVLFLLRQSEMEERVRLIRQTMSGEKWRLPTPKGKWRQVTDAEMVEIAVGELGWPRNVYEFGCAFIHLSGFHGYIAKNPFESLTQEQREEVLGYLRGYHGGPSSEMPTLQEIDDLLPAVFEKIRDNTEGYLESLIEHEPAEYVF